MKLHHLRKRDLVYIKEFLGLTRLILENKKDNRYKTDVLLLSDIIEKVIHASRNKELNPLSLSDLAIIKAYVFGNRKANNAGMKRRLVREMKSPR